MRKQQDPRQGCLPLPGEPPALILVCRKPDWKGRGRRPTRPRLFREGDAQNLHVRAPRTGRVLGRRYVCASLHLVEIEGRAPFWVAAGVQPLPEPGNGPSPGIGGGA